MRRAAALAAALAAGLLRGLAGGAGSTDDDVMTIDIYRAMEESKDGMPEEEDDVADIGGVLKYIHTEIMTEHLLGPPSRRTRKYGIDCIRRHRYWIKNPPALLRSKWQIMMDFGPFVTYDSGVATNPSQLPIIGKYGNWVGVQTGCVSPSNCDPRFPSEIPYFWFSVGNRCPNLHWHAKKADDGSASKQCLRLTNSTDYILGGLCPDGPGAQVLPTGENGCVYSYGESEILRLDDLVGIRGLDCGSRPCKSWEDFRRNCTDGEYRWQFTGQGSNIEAVDYCVEYDIHPACEASCHTPECKRIREQGFNIELGLPFWHGRCDARANVRRMEHMAHAFRIPGARQTHRLRDEALRKLDKTCLSHSNLLCLPVPARGGPYCSREFSGVCLPCFIPGTAQGQARPEPFCPLDILWEADYRQLPRPICQSREPRDLCCLYLGSCDGEADPDWASLDDNGLALVAAGRSTTAMARFLRRAALEHGRHSLANSSELPGAAYWQWARAPPGRTLEEALDGAEAFLALPGRPPGAWLGGGGGGPPEPRRPPGKLPWWRGPLDGARKTLQPKNWNIFPRETAQDWWRELRSRSKFVFAKLVARKYCTRVPPPLRPLRTEDLCMYGYQAMLPVGVASTTMVLLALCCCCRRKQTTKLESLQGDDDSLEAEGSSSHRPLLSEGETLRESDVPVAEGLQRVPPQGSQELDLEAASRTTSAQYMGNEMAADVGRQVSREPSRGPSTSGLSESEILPMRKEASSSEFSEASLSSHAPLLGDGCSSATGLRAVHEKSFSLPPPVCVGDEATRTRMPRAASFDAVPPLPPPADSPFASCQEDGHTPVSASTGLDTGGATSTSSSPAAAEDRGPPQPVAPPAFTPPENSEHAARLAQQRASARELTR